MIIHHPERERWVQIDRRTIEDKSLSWKARGMLAYLLSKPHNWTVYTAELVKASPGGRDAVLAGLRELEEAGYIVRNRRHDPASGQWDSMDVYVYERPQTENPAVVSGALCGKSGSGKPVGGKSAQSKEGIAVTTESSDDSSLAPTVVDAGEFAALRQSLAEACGTDLDRATSSEAGRVARATKDILDHGGKAADVPRAVAAYRRLLPTALMTETALAGHWSRLTATGVSPASTSEGEKAGVRLANRGASRAEARDELAEIFDDDEALVDEGLTAFDRRCVPDRQEESG